MQTAINNHTENFRNKLANIEALPQLTLLGLIIGVLAGVIIIAFRLAIDLPLATLLPLHSDNFEALSPQWRFALPFVGAIAIGVVLQFIDPKYISVSASHVLDRLHRFQGRMPLGNIVVQFFAGIACLLCGQSVGREGPAIHLGAGSASLLGQWLNLPNNSLRPLIGCGVAAAISASFNTPVAGVIFAMEVILMEYTIAGFIPVILASVTGAAMTRMVFGHGLALESAGMQIVSLWELPYVILCGLAIAICAAAFIRIQLLCQPLQRYPIAIRLSAAGFLTGLAAIYSPQILGVGYDTISDALQNNLAFTALLLIILCKLIVTATSLGLGMPGGVIGPTLFLGACVGAALGIIGSTIFPGAASPGFYALLGMAAMMAAVLNAPLAALIAVLELTGNSNALFPGMLMIVVACLSTRQLFGCDSIFQSLLEAQGKTIDAGADQQVLSRAGVISLMSTDFIRSPQQLTHSQALLYLQSKPQWLMVHEAGDSAQLLRAADLAMYIEHINAEDNTSTGLIDLLEISGMRREIAPIEDIANLYEASIAMRNLQVDALYVIRHSGNNSSQPATIKGIITREALDTFYLRPPN